MILTPRNLGLPTCDVLVDGETGECLSARPLPKLQGFPEGQDRMGPQPQWELETTACTYPDDGLTSPRLPEKVIIEYYQAEMGRFRANSVPMRDKRRTQCYQGNN